MHLQLNRRLKPFAVIIASAMLASCASAPVYTPAEVEDRNVVNQKNTLESNDSDSAGVILDTDPILVEDLNRTKGDFYQDQANNATNQQSRIDDVLSAAEFYIQGNDYDQVQNTIDTLSTYSLNPIQQDRFTVIQAYSLYSRGLHKPALSALEPLLSDLYAQPEPLNEPDFTSDFQSDNVGNDFSQTAIPDAPTLTTQQVDALLLSSFSYQALNDYDSALDALIKRERSLYGKARSETTRYIWQIVNSLDTQQRQEIIQSTQNALVRNRLEQSVNTQVATLDYEPQQFGQWRQESLNQIQKQAIDSQWNSASPKKVAVLLPISSKFNKAAIALQDGIMQQHDQNQSPYKPQLQFYDIGDQAYQAAQYYSAAVNSGADFIIGPLGKDYANQINNFGGSRVPTLLLGGDSALNSTTSRFDLSPEMEGRRIAERAWRDGHISTAILLNQSNHNRRAVEGFTQAWLNLGGKIAKTIYYSPNQVDHSPELKELFDINQSESRHSQLSRTLGSRPKFSAYQRHDIDFIFMLADAKAGRLVRPQINFFSGSSVPVYSTSKIFNGIQDKVNNVDLDSTRFPIMPWVLKSAEVAPYAGQLNQLFALGSDAYSVSGNFNQLRNQASNAINGRTGQVSINEYGEVVNHPIWASFKEGEVIAEDSLGIDITPLTAPNNGSRNVNGNYNGNSSSYGNSKTYDSNTWDTNKSQNKD